MDALVEHVERPAGEVLVLLEPADEEIRFQFIDDAVGHEAARDADQLGNSAIFDALAAFMKVVALHVLLLLRDFPCLDTPLSFWQAKRRCLKTP